MTDASLEGIIPVVYAELRRLASAYLRGERAGHTLQTTDLVHEAYLRMCGQQASWANSEHVLGIAARQMRRVLVDHARARQRLKRSGDLLVAPAGTEQPGVEVIALDAALDELAGFDPRQAEIVELRYFGGLTAEETSRTLTVSLATVHREWAMARAWLRHRLESGGGDDT